jgi:DnaJ-class molecular chaperone
MAREHDGSDGGDPVEASHGPQECMPCRGTGRVVSNLGGESKRIQCPWCGGDGERKHGVDAQGRWLEGAVQSAPVPAGAGS